MLHELTLTVCIKSTRTRVSSFCVLTACLHIISPAGMFLSAPYAESSFSFLNFVGCYFYAKAMLKHDEGRESERDHLILLSGVVFGIATTFRGNGLLSGLLLVWNALACGTRILRSIDITGNVRHLLVVSVSGLLMACIAAVPQYLAYSEYCGRGIADTDRRPWCSSWPPSIYTGVQRQYWWVFPSGPHIVNLANFLRAVGFLNYWTISNLPLFLLATPMIFILTRSGIWALRGCSNSEVGAIKGSPDNIEFGPPLHIDQAIARCLATPQIVLAILALTSYHVQIITRLSSGYPVWYWWLASLTLEDRESISTGRKWNTSLVISRWMVIYAIVQGGLFASFLPPA